MQYVLELPPQLRSNGAYTFILRKNTVADREFALNFFSFTVRASGARIVVQKFFLLRGAQLLGLRRLIALCYCPFFLAPIYFLSGDFPGLLSASLARKMRVPF
jgi:hypothetical protein